MPIKRREIIENSIRFPGITGVFVGGGLGYALASGVSPLLYTGLMVVGVILLGYVFNRSVHQAENKISAWESEKLNLEVDTSTSQ